jgi:hypothetical protein
LRSGPPGEDAIGYALQPIFDPGRTVAEEKRRAALGLVQRADRRRCQACLVRIVERKADGELQEW